MSDHGTVASYSSKRSRCRCELCRWAAARYEKERVYKRAQGMTRLVDSTIARRQIQGMWALGWTSAWIAQQLGCGDLPRVKPLITAARAARIDALARRVGDRWGPSDITRRRAVKLGYRVPAWWDDWQDPEPLPEVDWRTETREQREDEVGRLSGHGLSAGEIAVRLGVTQRQVVRDRRSRDERGIRSA